MRRESCHFRLISVRYTAVVLRYILGGSREKGSTWKWRAVCSNKVPTQRVESTLEANIANIPFRAIKYPPTDLFVPNLLQPLPLAGSRAHTALNWVGEYLRPPTKMPPVVVETVIFVLFVAVSSIDGHPKNSTHALHRKTMRLHVVLAALIAPSCVEGFVVRCTAPSSTTSPVSTSLRCRNTRTMMTLPTGGDFSRAVGAVLVGGALLTGAVDVARADLSISPRCEWSICFGTGSTPHFTTASLYLCQDMQRN